MMLLTSRSFTKQFCKISRKFSTNGGGNGDIRGAGGAFSKKEKAQEEQYFRQKEKEELEQFKKNLETKKKDETPKPSKK